MTQSTIFNHFGVAAPNGWITTVFVEQPLALPGFAKYQHMSFTQSAQNIINNMSNLRKYYNLKQQKYDKYVIIGLKIFDQASQICWVM